ncbi:Hypothetical predicted protein, partial [Pelobates cultripes]
MNDLPTIAATLQTWKKIHQYPELTPTPSPKYPISHNPLLPMGKGGILKKPQSSQTTNSYTALGDLITDGGLKSLGVITGLTQNQITLTHTFQYHQLKHFLSKEGLFHWKPREETLFEKWCSNPPTQKIVAKCYNMMQTITDKHLPLYTRAGSRWFSAQMNADAWTAVFIKMMKTNPSIPLQEINYKFLSHWYTTPVDIHKYDTQHSPTCWRCKEEQDTYHHIWWSCRRIEAFWKE